MSIKINDMSERDYPLLVTAGYLIEVVGVGAFLWYLCVFWGDDILYSFQQLWGNGLVLDGLERVWPMFVWGIVATVAIRLVKGRGTTESRLGDIAYSWWVSLNAGVFEELVYRVLLFFTAMVMVRFINWISFGLVGWFYNHILIPLANLFTLHALDAQLHDPRTWIVGAAIVSVSMQFRNAHEHLGPIGYVNSWFIGMVMFWLMFNFGLLTAIVAHVVYDILVFTTAVLMAEKEEVW